MTLVKAKVHREDLFNFNTYKFHLIVQINNQEIFTSIDVTKEFLLQVSEPERYIKQTMLMSMQQHFGLSEHHTWLIAQEIDLDWPKPKPAVEQSSLMPLGGNYISQKVHQLPGVKQPVIYPCHCYPLQNIISQVIIHLNDTHRWSRNKIADWLDELADAGTIDIDFKPKENDNVDQAR